jgi:hypothetical protein
MLFSFPGLDIVDLAIPSTYASNLLILMLSSIILEIIKKIMCKRLNHKKNHNSPVTHFKFALFTTFSFTIVSSGIYTIFLIVSASNFGETSTANNPTSIPWIDNQATCAKTGRTWSDDKCWDYEHNALF